jgi:hypothetical protein
MSASRAPDAASDFDVVLERVHDSDIDEPWIDAVARAAGPGAVVIHNGETVVDVRPRAEVL